MAGIDGFKLFDDRLHGLFFSIQARGFGKKLVCNADNDLLNSQRYHIPQGKWKVVLPYVHLCYPGPCVAFRNKGVAWKTKVVKELPSKESVAQIWMTAKASKVWGPGHENPDVVEHGCLFKKQKIYFGMGYKRCYLKALLRHLLTVA